jgi:hypothetical protein
MNERTNERTNECVSVLPREADWAAVLARWAEIVALKLDNTYVV